jgi:uncharacterized repeat protein (TIGR03843 family)
MKIEGIHPVHWLPGDDPECEERLVAWLTEGAMALEGLLPWGSNYTFLGKVAGDTEDAAVVYKPVRGERPLWDFPHGTLAQREVAAYVLSQALAWWFVPPTVLRDGPHGLGSVQLFVDVDQDAHFFTFHEDPSYRSALQRLAAFDILANNADRKGGHCLKGESGSILAIDHGVCFSAQPKLRTVIWDFAGEPLPAHLVADLCRLQEALRGNSPLVQQFAALLTRDEISALRNRTGALIETATFPAPPENRRPFPWPLV